MKKTLIVLFLVVGLFSCKKDKTYPITRTITNGNQWDIEIGEPADMVYLRLQILGREKQFSQVAVVGRQPYSSPQAIENLLSFYDYLSIEKNTPVIDRALLQFPGDVINYISAGSGLTDSVSKWPKDVPDAIAIHKNDSVNQLYTRLTAILQQPGYSNSRLILPDKPLKKAYDPDMANYGEWGFSIVETVRSRVVGNYAVRLYFKDNRLNKIYYEYTEHDYTNMVNYQ